MLFSSIPFLYYFLACVLVLYFIAPKKLKNTVIFLSSLFFYAWGELRCVILVLVAITLGYAFGLIIEKYRDKRGITRVFLSICVIAILGMLGYYKYADFFIGIFNSVTGLSIPFLKIALPIGISFYSFQIISYIADVYRGVHPAERNYIDLAAYILFFPQLIAGPIVRYKDVAADLEARTHSFEKASTGIRRFIIGLSKKVLIANLLGELCANFQASTDLSVLYFWMNAISYALQIYFDFSGYSDMAIGLVGILGFNIPENFNYPFISASITEFWRRWHMSLGSWFRDYVYIPLGGNRVSALRHIFNILVVWMLTGLWHGASWNFVLWGLFYAVLLIIEKLFLLRFIEKTKVIKHVYVILLTIIGFVLFSATDLSLLGTNLSAMFGLSGYAFTSAETLYYLRSYGVLLVIAIVGSTPLIKIVWNKLKAGERTGNVMAIVEPLTLCLLLAVCTAFLVDGSFNPFLYFRF